MANLATLKAALNAAVYQNTQNAITGESLNTILTKIIDTLGAGYRYAGVATPSANPGTIDNRVFYLATAAGTYTNFGAAVLDGKALHVFIYDTTWHDVALDVPTTAALAVVTGNGTNSVKGKDARCVAEGTGSVAIGYTEVDNNAGSTASIDAEAEGAHAEGYASGNNGHSAQIFADAEGSHAEGCANVGSGNSFIVCLSAGAHAEGYASDGKIEAGGDGAHAEGYAVGANIFANGNGAHAEGSTSLVDGNIIADAEGSHAEGSGSQAFGEGSHAEGCGTRARNYAEHAEGKFNVSHTKTTGTEAEQAAGSTLSSIGAGEDDDTRENAVEVMQNGDVYIKGVGGYDGISIDAAAPIQGCIFECLNTSAAASEVEDFILNQSYGLSDFATLFASSIIKGHISATGITTQPLVKISPSVVRDFVGTTLEDYIADIESVTSFDFTIIAFAYNPAGTHFMIDGSLDSATVVVFLFSQQYERVLPLFFEL